MRFRVLLIPAILLAAVIYVLKSENQITLRLFYDKKVSLRIKIFLINQLIRYDFIVGENKTVMISDRGKKLVDALKKPGNQRRIRVLDLLEGVGASWTLKIRTGTDDAAETAVLAGFLAAFLKTLAVVSLRFAPSQRQRIVITPAVNKGAKISFTCMFTIKTGHIIRRAAHAAAKNFTEARK